MRHTSLFVRLYLAKLSVDHAYALVHSTVEQVQQASLHLDPLTRQAALHMMDCNAALEAHLKPLGQQEHTRQIRTLDHQCGVQWAAIKRSVRFYGQDGNAAQQAAAHQLALFLQPYGNLPQAALNTQMRLLAELSTKYAADTALRKAAEVLGVQERMQQLHTLNNALVQTYHQRNVLATARTRTNTQLKLESLAAYRRFCVLLEQACLYTQSEPLLALVALLNGYRAKYQAIVVRRKVRSAVVAHSLPPTENPVHHAAPQEPDTQPGSLLPTASVYSIPKHHAAGAVPLATLAPNLAPATTASDQPSPSNTATQIPLASTAHTSPQLLLPAIYRGTLHSSAHDESTRVAATRGVPHLQPCPV